MTTELASKLLIYLRERLQQPSLTYAAEPKPLSGGSFTAVFVFTLTDPRPEWAGELVLRMVPWMPMQVRTEAGLQDGAVAAGFPAPRILAVEATDEPLGTKFLIMERLAGTPFLRGVDPLGFARDFPKVVRSWPSQFESIVRQLMSVDTDLVRKELGRHGVPEQFFLTTRHLDWAEGLLANEPGLTDALQWLRANQPPLPEQLALVHGDLWPANALMDGARLAGLVDWTMGAIGDAALDVGFATAGWRLSPEPFPPPPPIRQLIDRLGDRIANEMSERGAPLVGGEERVRYFEALRCAVQLAFVVAQRRVEGRSGWDHGVRALCRHLATITNRDVALSVTTS